MKKATFNKNEVAFVRRCGDTNNSASIRKMQGRANRRKTHISHNQTRLIASLYWGDE